MTCEIVWTAEARAGFGRVRSEDLAKRISRAIDDLAIHPERGMPRPGGRFVLIIGGWPIVYRRIRIDAIALLTIGIKEE